LNSLTNYQEKSAAIKDKYPFYSWACENIDGYKGRSGNVEFRRKCIEKGVSNRDYAQELWVMCSRDLLFWVNTFVMTYDPRLVPKSTVVPFVTYPFQDVAFDDIKSAIEVGFDELTEKSRDMGASWMYLLVYVWFFCFRPYQAFRMMSRTEDLVDKRDDPDCLFWKVLFTIKHLPGFLKPNFDYTHLHLKNMDNNSTIDGCTTTSDAARGGRCTSMLIDEFAAVPDGNGVLRSTRDVTRCRVFNSTHKGAGTAFYGLSQGKTKKLVIHWSLHPVKARGLYYSKNGELIICDTGFKGKVVVNGEEYDFPDKYPFRLDGKVRSPWYDNECDRAVHPMEIAQELDIDPFAADFQYFHGDMIAQIEKEDVRPPYLQGMLEFDEDTCEPLGFAEAKEGPLRLWVNPDAYGHIPNDIEAACGIDIAAGTGASNSAATIVSLKTGEKLAEYASAWIKPESYAKVAVALCKWFNGAYMIWDGGGHGRTFGDTAIKLYRNVYYRRNEKSITKRVSDIPGCFLNPDEKKSVLGGYRRALKDKTFTQRSHEANQECLGYVFTAGNSIEHSSAVNTVDPSGARDNHGDRVIADALANKALELLGSGNKVTEPEKKMPANCYAARRKEYEKQLKAGKEW